MKKSSSVLVLLIMAVAFVLVGCASGLAMPLKSAEVKGNGGYVVQKGEYLYFTNAYTGYSSLDGEVSNGDKNTEYGIYRVKVSDTVNGIVSYDENGFAKNVEKVVSKLSGFENSNLYIVGDYLFFASPNMHKTNENKNRFDLISIFSVKLDGSNLKELYTTSSYTNGDWTVLEIDETNYLVTFEGDKIVRHTIKSNKLENKTELAKDVISALLPDNVKTDFDKAIYYTTSRSEQEQEFGQTGNILSSVQVATKESRTFDNPEGETVTLLKLQDSRIFYNKNSQLYTYNGQTETRLSLYSTATNLFYLSEKNLIVYTLNSKLITQEIGKLEDEGVLVDENVTPIMVDGDYVYYTKDSKVYRISVLDKLEQLVFEETFESGKFDFDGRYFYVFANLKTGSSVKYMHRADTYNIEQGTSKALVPLGFVLKADVDAKIEADKAAAAEQEN